MYGEMEFHNGSLFGEFNKFHLKWSLLYGIIIIVFKVDIIMIISMKNCIVVTYVDITWWRYSSSENVMLVVIFGLWREKTWLSQAQTILRIRIVWSVHLFFAHAKVQYLSFNILVSHSSWADCFQHDTGHGIVAHPKSSYLATCDVIH